MTTTEQLGYAWTAWSYAVDKKYVESAILRHVGQECFNLLIGGLAGIVAAVGGVMVCTAAGAGAGAAIGGYFSAGNPAAAYAAAELGATIGQTIAETALTLLGIGMIINYMASHMWEIGSLAIAAYDIAVNQMPYLGGEIYAYLLDLAARWFAEAVGMFCGFLVFAIAMLVLARVAKSEKGETAAQSVRDLFQSKLNELCKGLVQWIVPRASELRFSLKPAGKAKFSVINGGVKPEQMSIITKTLTFTKRFVPKVIQARPGAEGLVRAASLAELDSQLTGEGFRLTSWKNWGPPGGKQFFYEKGNICVRLKSLGDARGKRPGQPQISFGVNDGTGTAWVNDMAKVTAEGRLTFKLDTPVSRFSPTETITDPLKPTQQRYVGIMGGKQQGNPDTLQDAWADNCHFYFDGKFDWTGLDKLAKSAPQLPD